MKLIINKNQIDGTPEQFLRKAGYAYIRDRKTGKESFVRRLGSGFYPRLHMYVSERGKQIIFDLHLDQKQASYAGQKMHSGEYDGEVVEREIERLRELVSNHGSQTIDHGSHDNLEKKIGHEELPKEDVKPEKPSFAKASAGKKSWWRKLFS